MANPAAQARANAQTTWPGTAVSARSRKAIEHQHPSDPNRFMFDTSIGPLHYGVSEDQEIDTAWQSGIAPWDHEMVKAGYNAFALDDFSSGQIVKYVDPISGEDVAFQPQQLQYTNDLDQIQPIADPQSVNAVVTDDELYWTGAYGTDIDLKWHAQTARLDKRLIIQNASALPAVQQFIIDGGNPVLRVQFIFQHSNGVNLFVNDVEWDEKVNNPVETSGIVEFRDASENVVWSFNLPRSFETDGFEDLIGTFRLRKTGPNLFVEHRVPIDWLQAATYPVEIDVTVDEIIATGDDDARQNFGGAMSLTTSQPRLEDTTNEYTIGRFTSVAIPNAATIDVATMNMSASVGSRDTLHATVYGDDVDDSAQPTTTSGDISNRAPTTATTNWDAVNTGVTEITSPSIVGIIAEITVRGGWATGQNLSLIIQQDTGESGDMQHWHYDGSTTDAYDLHVEYTAAAAGRIMSSLAEAGGLAARGGIAGPGGGLAG